MNKKILIVDDDRTVIALLTPFLTSHGFTVASSHDGEEGIAMVADNAPDLIVLDVQMPKMNGYTFVYELKKKVGNRVPPIIVLTAKEGMAEIFKVEGVQEYLTKPIDMQKLLEVVRKLI